MKEIKADLNKWEDIPFSWIGKRIVKMAILLKLIYRFNPIPIKLPDVFFFFRSYIFKIIRKFKGLIIARTIFKKNEVGGLTLSFLKTYYKAAVSNQDRVVVT